MILAFHSPLLSTQIIFNRTIRHDIVVPQSRFRCQAPKKTIRLHNNEPLVLIRLHNTGSMKAKARTATSITLNTWPRRPKFVTFWQSLHGDTNLFFFSQQTGWKNGGFTVRRAVLDVSVRSSRPVRIVRDGSPDLLHRRHRERGIRQPLRQQPVLPVGHHGTCGPGKKDNFFSHFHRRKNFFSKKYDTSVYEGRAKTIVPPPDGVPSYSWVWCVFSVECLLWRLNNFPEMFRRRSGREKNLKSEGHLEAAFTAPSGSILLENLLPSWLSPNCGNKCEWHSVLSHKRRGERKVKRHWSVENKLEKENFRVCSDFLGEGNGCISGFPRSRPSVAYLGHFSTAELEPSGRWIF